MARSYERSLLIRGGFSCFSDTPIGKGPGVEYFEGMGMGSRSVKVLVLGRPVWLKKRGRIP